MKPAYEDIKSLIKKDPTWYDQHGVPRYSDFSPKYASNIYSDEVILILIQCQNCHQRFSVELNHNKNLTKLESLEYRTKNWNNYNLIPIHYGDPPIHDCVGDTMNSEPIKIIEFWKQEKGIWVRKKELEVEF